MAASSLDGGAGNDLITAAGAGSTVLGGDGNDTIAAAEGSTLGGGAGQDSFALPSGFAAAEITIGDFTPGAAGDRLDFSELLAYGCAGYDGSNPFGTSGWLQLRQDGADTVIDLDADGGADGLVAMLRLQQDEDS